MKTCGKRQNCEKVRKTLNSVENYSFRKMYYILKLEGNHLKLWSPAKRYFVEENVQPYHSYQLVYRIWKRLTADQRRYNSNWVKIVKVETFERLCEDFIFQPKNFIWERNYKR